MAVMVVEADGFRVSAETHLRIPETTSNSYFAGILKKTNIPNTPTCDGVFVRCHFFA